MKDIRRTLAIVAVIAAVVWLVARFNRDRFHAWGVQRERIAVETQGDISIAVVWPYSKPSLVRGVQMAADEINAAGGVAVQTAAGEDYAARLRLRFFDEDGSGAGLAAARHAARDRSTLAALGHDGKSALGSSIVYNNSGILFLAPTSLETTLTQHGFPFVFRMAPDVKQYARAMVDTLDILLPPRRIRIAVLYPQTLQAGEDLAGQLNQQCNAILKQQDNRGRGHVSFDTVLAEPYDPRRPRHDEAIAGCLNYPELYDVILVLDVLPAAGEVVEQLKNDVERRASGKVIVSLDDLDWRGDQVANYATFTPSLGPAYYRRIVDLVLRETRPRVAVLLSRDAQGKSLASEISTALQSDPDDPYRQYSQVAFRSYLPSTQLFADLVAELQDKQPDMIFVAGSSEPGLRLIRQIRDAGLEQPVVCGPDLESGLRTRRPDPALAGVRDTLRHWLKEDDKRPASGRRPADEIYGLLRSDHDYRGSAVAVRRYVAEARGGTYVASTFDVNNFNQSVQNFVQRFKKRYPGRSVNSLAVDGYQAVYLLADAFARSRSRSPTSAAESLRLFVRSRFGDGGFSPAGEMTSRPIFFQRISSEGVAQPFRAKPKP